MPISRSSTSLRRTSIVGMCALLLSGCVTAPPNCSSFADTSGDPAGGTNRAIFSFNRTVDDYVLAPVSRGYTHLPQFIQTGTHNFVTNFGEPKVFINDVLQGNGGRSITTLGRFVINTTVGIVGLIDVSGKVGIQRHTADFGQTFGVWNIANGPIVELPLLGTGNLRDGTGKMLSFLVSPLGDNSGTIDAMGTASTVGGVVDGRAEALPTTDRLRTSPDYYRALRDAVARKRAAFVMEGKSGEVGTQPAATQCR